MAIVAILALAIMVFALPSQPCGSCRQFVFGPFVCPSVWLKRSNSRLETDMMTAVFTDQWSAFLGTHVVVQRPACRAAFGCVPRRRVRHLNMWLLATQSLASLKGGASLQSRWLCGLVRQISGVGCVELGLIVALCVCVIGVGWG